VFGDCGAVGGVLFTADAENAEKLQRRGRGRTAWFRYGRELMRDAGVIGELAAK
jgi:hypothetical protein